MPCSIPPSALLPWKKIHLIKENIYDGSLLKLYSGDWEFSHLDNSIAALLEANLDSSIYLYGSVESCGVGLNGDLAPQAPYITAIIVPQGHIPTNMVGHYNNQACKEEIHPFEYAKYRWIQAKAQEFQNRVYHLVCDADMVWASEEKNADYYFHEHTNNLFTIVPADLS
mmetsp:Transcript_19979/g.31406  ORF Transcript_19979/g.31406 Transcript_19979/m.31406 type:complete len:169 (+) Transcript_19979:16-522(+)